MKKIVFLSILLLLTGCSGTYRLTMTDTGGVKEEVYLSESVDDILISNASVSLYLDTELKLVNNEGLYSKYKPSAYIDGNYGVGYGKKEYYNFVEDRVEETLSDFEKQVLHRYTNGESYTHIAERLNAPVKSVDNAIQRIRKKAVKNILNYEE